MVFQDLDLSIECVLSIVLSKKISMANSVHNPIIDTTQPPDSKATGKPQVVEVNPGKAPFQFRLSTLLIGMTAFALLTFHVAQRIQAKAKLQAISDDIDTFASNEAKPFIETLRSSDSDKKIKTGIAQRTQFNGFLFQNSVHTQNTSFIFKEDGFRTDHVFFSTRVELSGTSYQPTAKILVPINTTTTKFNDPVVEKLEESLEAKFDIEVDIVPADRLGMKPLEN